MKKVKEEREEPKEVGERGKVGKRRSTERRASVAGPVIIITWGYVRYLSYYVLNAMSSSSATINVTCLVIILQA